VLAPLLMAFDACGHRIVRYEGAPKRDHGDEYADAAHDRDAALVERGDQPTHQAMKQREVHIWNFAIFCMM
jgi:hypothetical protein